MNGFADQSGSVVERGASMTSELARIVRRADLTGWKTVDMGSGDQTVPVRVPESCRVLEMSEVPPLTHPREAIHRSIHSPIGCHPSRRFSERKGSPPATFASASRHPSRHRDPHQPGVHRGGRPDRDGARWRAISWRVPPADEKPSARRWSAATISRVSQRRIESWLHQGDQSRVWRATPPHEEAAGNRHQGRGRFHHQYGPEPAPGAGGRLLGPPSSRPTRRRSSSSAASWPIPVDREFDIVLTHGGVRSRSTTTRSPRRP